MAAGDDYPAAIFMTLKRLTYFVVLMPYLKRKQKTIH